MTRKEIPVYLFTGFLDAGKTTFIQETLEDTEFNDDNLPTLLLVCEEGEGEYNPDKFAIKNIDINDHNYSHVPYNQLLHYLQNLHHNLHQIYIN